MRFGAVSILGYSHILLIIVRRMSHLVKYPNFATQVYYRILIASIRNLGRCPCPRCLITLDCVVDMGKRRDMTQRETLARIDDMSRRNRVDSAREIIYEKNYAVDGNPVENLLKVDSLVPTAVSDLFLSLVVISGNMHIFRYRTHFPANWHNSGFAYILCSLWILCTSLNLVSGERFSSTSCAFWTAMMKVSNMNWTDGMPLRKFKGLQYSWPVL